MFGEDGSVVGYAGAVDTIVSIELDFGGGDKGLGGRTRAAAWSWMRMPWRRVLSLDASGVWASRSRSILALCGRRRLL